MQLLTTTSRLALQKWRPSEVDAGRKTKSGANRTSNRSRREEWHYSATEKQSPQHRESDKLSSLHAAVKG